MRPSSLAPRAPAHLGFRATLAAILGVGAAFALGCDAPTYAVAGALAAVTVRIALIDLGQRIILDRDVIAMAAIGCAWTLSSGFDPAADLLQGVLHGLGYAAIFQSIRLAYRLLRHRDGLGFGDVKLVAAAGPLLTIEAFAYAVAGGALGGLAFVILRACQKRRWPTCYTYVPIGSALAIAIYGAWLLSVGLA